MGSASSKESVCSLVEEVTLKLDKDNNFPSYTGLVICADMLMVVDYNKKKLQLHNRYNGELLTTPHQLERSPKGMCLVSNKEVAVILEGFVIEILSLESIHNIKQVKVLNVTPVFHTCHAVAKVESMENIVLSGLNQDQSLCWCIVSLIDGHADTIHRICTGDYFSRSHLAVKHNTVYISCQPFERGVYSYFIPNPDKPKFVYRHQDLKSPMGLTVDTRGYIFVCNRKPDFSIYQLTERGELVTIHRLSSLPIEIFYEEQGGYIYITNGYHSHELYTPHSNAMTRYRLEYPHQQDLGIPAEVLKMDPRSLDMYKDALRDGKEKVYSIRVMVVGHYGAGKTTLTKRLLGKDVTISERNSTEGIDVHTEICKVSLATKEWIIQEKNAEWYSRLQRLVKLINGHAERKDLKGEQEGPSVMDNQVASGAHDNGHPQHDPPIGAERDTSLEDESTLHLALLPIGHMIPESSIEMSQDAVMEILRLVNENSDKLDKSLVDYATLTLLDFAGQYAFYTTHQTFLTRRAVYLLVIDLSQQLEDLIDDECFLDMKGIELRKVHDWVEIWLNSIHSCSPSTESGIPPVILVGTHVDKIPEKIRQQVIDKYFIKLREMLKEKPVRFHLMDDIAIDNTVVDPMLEELKGKIFEQASKQTYWGEEKPARWLPLEQAIMSLKATGVKVATFNDVEKINKSGSVRIEDKDELDLFLRFQHEMGTILFFSVEGLREKIVLDPQWLINALKSMITSEMFIRKNPAIINKWFDFRDKGILTPELIDAVWTKEKHPELFANKDHILLLMQNLNIIAKPRSFTENGEKEDDYYLAPCMLSEATPEEIICPESNPEIPSTAVLCFKCTGMFLPSPIFHRLVGACLTHWAIAKQDEKNLIYCGCCAFDLDHYHRLTLYFREYAIFARVTRRAVRGINESSNLCSQARTFILDNLNKIVGNLGKTLKFELYIQCPNSKADSLRGLIPLALIQKEEKVICDSHVKSHTLVSQDLCKFWFEEEEHHGKNGGYSDLPKMKTNRKFLHTNWRFWQINWRFWQKNWKFWQTNWRFWQWITKESTDADKDKFSTRSKPGDIISTLPIESSRSGDIKETVSIAAGNNRKQLSEQAEVPKSTFEFSTRSKPGDIISTLPVESSRSGDIKESVSIAAGNNRKQLSEQAEVPKSTFEQRIEPLEQIYTYPSAPISPEEYQVSSQKRALPPGKKYHIFFSYSSSDIQWVKETVERLEQDHGFICCEYDRDNTPGTPLLRFADDSIKSAYKTLIVMTMDAFQSGFVLHEIEMALIQGFEEKRKCVVPVLVKDCDVPRYLRILNYVDARDAKNRNTWWPKLLMELVSYGNIDIQNLAQVHEVRDGAMNIASKFHHPRGVSCSTPKLLFQALNKSEQNASSSQSILKTNCQRARLEFHGETPGNGNCFFEAVSSQLQRLNCVVQKSPQQLRQDVVAFMKTNRVLHGSEGTIDLAAFICNETFDKYCAKMACDGEWADHVVVLAMARKLQRDIMIITSSPSSGPDDNIVWVDGQADLQEDPILLGHVFEHHYQSLQPIGYASLASPIRCPTPDPTDFPIQALKSSSTSNT